jgi:hypothetical protein
MFVLLYILIRIFCKGFYIKNQNQILVQDQDQSQDNMYLLNGDINQVETSPPKYNLIDNINTQYNLPKYNDIINN